MRWFVLVVAPVVGFTQTRAPGDAEAGRRLFQSNCIVCHNGAEAPNLASAAFRHANTDEEMKRVIQAGIPGTLMAGVNLDDAQITNLVAYIRGSRITTPPATGRGAAPNVAAPLVGPLSYQRLVSAASEPRNWLTYSGNYSSNRHSSLRQIDRSNVSRLKMKWVNQTGAQGKFETTPLVVNGVMYATRPPSDVVALDPETGQTYWQYRRTMPTPLNLCCGQVNRGVAMLGEWLFLGTLDGHLVALDARTGQVQWDVEVGDRKAAYSLTAAPLIVKDKVITGIGGGEYGIRGFLEAFDAKTGKRLWRFWTIPAPGEPGSETWSGDAWKTGGGATWLTGSYDPQLNLIYWGVGNPGPDLDGSVRPGDNLYSGSVIALDADTGTLKWHFQFTPHDVHDWDAVQIPILVDADWNGRPRKLMYWANRNAFFYVLDRATGEFLSAKPFVKQTWAKGMDERGRPIRLPNTDPTPAGTLLYPGMQGGTNWYSPSYSPLTRLFYMSYWDYASIYYLTEGTFSLGNRFMGGRSGPVPGDPGYGGVMALNPLTGEKVWDVKNPTTPHAGVLSTAGNLVFGGNNEGSFFALDAESGKQLWKVNLGGGVAAGPVTYLSGGKQVIAVAAGGNLFAFDVD